MSTKRAQRNRRPSRSRRPGPARRFLRTLPKKVERLEAVQHAALYLDEREEEARRSALALEKNLKVQLQHALRTWDLWLKKVGLMRVAAHQEELRRARAPKSAKKAAKKRPVTRTGAAAPS